MVRTRLLTRAAAVQRCHVAWRDSSARNSAAASVEGGMRPNRADTAHESRTSASDETDSPSLEPRKKTNASTGVRTRDTAAPAERPAGRFSETTKLPILSVTWSRGGPEGDLVSLYRRRVASWWRKVQQARRESRISSFRHACRQNRSCFPFDRTSIRQDALTVYDSRVVTAKSLERTRLLIAMKRLSRRRQRARSALSGWISRLSGS